MKEPQKAMLLIRVDSISNWGGGIRHYGRSCHGLRNRQSGIQCLKINEVGDCCTDSAKRGCYRY